MRAHCILSFTDFSLDQKGAFNLSRENMESNWSQILIKISFTLPGKTHTNMLSAERQKGLITSYLQTQLDPFVSKMMLFVRPIMIP